MSSPLVSAAEALARLDDGRTVFVDATWYLPNVPKSARADVELCHIPHAAYFDIDEVADGSTDLPHMFPSADAFAACVGNLGISEESRIVVYDRSTFVASARVWWMFKSYGHADVQVLDGGLQAWQKAGGPTESGELERQACPYAAASPDAGLIGWKELAASVPNPDFSLLDARSRGRFSGEEPEPRPGLRGGHIPGSMNMYYGDVVNADGTMRSADEIASMLERLEVPPESRIVTTCGSGVTAAILLLAIWQLRQDGLRLYDGSWTEWALNPDSPL